jgi:hypothetical protein
MCTLKGTTRGLLPLVAASIAWLGACSSANTPDSTTHNTPGGSPVVLPGAVSAAGGASANGPGVAGSGTVSGIASGASGLGGSSTPPVGPRAMAVAGTGGARTPAASGAAAPRPAGMAMGGAAAPAANAGGDMVNVPLTPKGKNCLHPGNGNYTSPGPYKVGKKDVDLGMIASGQHTGKYTIYYPDPMEANCLHPIVVWGNGTGVTDSNFTYDFLNSNAASWGMVVAASSEDNTGSGEFHKAGINYLLKENMDASSMFHNKLSTRVGVSGHSQGGFGANVGAGHPNCVTAVVEGATMVASAKVSSLVMTGTMDIVSGAEALVNTAAGPMFVADWEGGNHVGTETVLGYLGLDTTSNDATGSQKGAQQFQRLYAAWFRCFLADDDVACKLFSGGAPGNCGICKDPGWHGLASKNL